MIPRPAVPGIPKALETTITTAMRAKVRVTGVKPYPEEGAPPPRL